MNMRYKAILLDADETILNFELAEEKALKILFSYLNMDYGLVSADYKKSIPRAGPHTKKAR